MMKKRRMPKPKATAMVPPMAQGESSSFFPSSSTIASLAEKLSALIPTMREGDVLGHEFMGDVVDVGREVTKVKKGDRVLLYMQNSPQFVLAYYAILRADAVVVPVNPMNLSEELRHYISVSNS